MPTGLHRSDISHLPAIINRLVDSGNTVVVIEHNLDIIKNADWIIEMGPEGGNNGGRVMFVREDISEPAAMREPDFNWQLGAPTELLRAIAPIIYISIEERSTRPHPYHQQLSEVL